MYKFYLKNVTKAHRYEELIKLFLSPDDFYIILDEKDVNSSRCLSVQDEIFQRLSTEKIFIREFEFELSCDADQLCREIFLALQAETGMRPKWGTMTGIRPVKMYRGAEERGLCGGAYLQEVYLLSDEKRELVREIYENQEFAFKKNDAKEVAIYIGIPFCPTRCHYCSFTSNQGESREIERYLNALICEIKFVSDQCKEKQLKIESLYIGGGTPTTLNEIQIEKLLSTLDSCFSLRCIDEVTVEAGRPDTITKGKLRIIKRYGVRRISINPQSTKDETLIRIGRSHNNKQLRESFLWSKEVGIKEINANVIAGLPQESLDDFAKTLDDVIEYDPTNVTVHTLALKRTSRISAENKNYNYIVEADIDGMLKLARSRLKAAGYTPYYLYRQKNMLGLGENIGFAKKGTEGLYNHRIMDERQTVIALGAGGISKLYVEDENRLERVPNVSNYIEYINRVDEMKERKIKGIFSEYR